MFGQWNGKLPGDEQRSFMGLLLGVALLIFFHTSAHANPSSLTYVRYKFNGYGALANLETNYYLDDERRRLLNDNKVEFGDTQQWSNESIIVASPNKGGRYITFINRLTGELQTYTEGKQLETYQGGTCVKSSVPVRKF